MGLRGSSRSVAPAALIAVVLVIASSTATASAARPWTGPVSLGPTGRESSPPQIAVTPDGEAVAVWEGGRSGGIQVSTRRPGKGWAPPVTLTTSRVAGEPQVAATAGKAVVVWGDAVGVDEHEASVIMAATRLRGRPWGRPRDISPARRAGEESEGEEPQVAINRRGKAVAIWTAGDERHRTASYIRSATQSATGTDWAAPIGIPGSTESTAPQVGMTPAGEAVGLWYASYNEESGIDVASLPAGGRWSWARRLAHPGIFPQPQLALTPRGEAIGAWVSGAEGEEEGLQVAAWRPGSRWRVSSLAPHEDAYEPTVVTGPGGRAMVVWVRSVGSERGVVVTSTHSPGGGWTAPVSLAAEGLPLPRESYPEIAMAKGGESIAIWASRGSRGERTIIRASSRSPGRPWRTPTNLSASPPAPMFGTADPEVAVGPSGEAFALWRIYDGSRWGIQAATRPARSSGPAT